MDDLILADLACWIRSGTARDGQSSVGFFSVGSSNCEMFLRASVVQAPNSPDSSVLPFMLD
jgi:hypothetical protein